MAVSPKCSQDRIAVSHISRVSIFVNTAIGIRSKTWIINGSQLIDRHGDSCKANLCGIPYVDLCRIVFCIFYIDTHHSGIYHTIQGTGISCRICSHNTNNVAAVLQRCRIAAITVRFYFQTIAGHFQVCSSCSCRSEGKWNGILSLQIVNGVIMTPVFQVVTACDRSSSCLTYGNHRITGIYHTTGREIVPFCMSKGIIVYLDHCGSRFQCSCHCFFF